MTTAAALLAMAHQLRDIDEVQMENVFVWPPVAENTKPPQIRINRSAGSNSPASIYPTFVVAEALTEQATWEIKSLGRLLHRWTAEIQLFLAPKATPLPEAERLAYGWQSKVAHALVASRSLGGSVYFIGGGALPSELMRCQAQYLSWYSQDDKEPTPFWGIRFLVPVVQYHEAVTNP